MTRPFYKELERIDAHASRLKDKDKRFIYAVEKELHLVTEIYDSNDPRRIIEVEKFHGDGIYTVCKHLREFLSQLHREITYRRNRCK